MTTSSVYQQSLFWIEHFEKDVFEFEDFLTENSSKLNESKIEGNELLNKAKLCFAKFKLHIENPRENEQINYQLAKKEAFDNCEEMRMSWCVMMSCYGRLRRMLCERK